MIEIKSVTKKFGDFTALNNISCTIENGSVFGLVGTNGAGKSTLVRCIAGVYKTDEGSILIDGENVYDNPAAKAKVVYVSDDIYYPNPGNINDLGKLYARMYSSFNSDKYLNLIDELQLSRKKSVSSFSKGMRRQAVTAAALAVEPDYIIFDETFDGLDPLVRDFFKKLIIKEVAERSTTAIITSHSLRELEDTCDKLAMLHKGGLILESDLSEIESNYFKVQVAFKEDYDEKKFKDLSIAEFKKNGAISTFIVNGDKDETTRIIGNMNPLIFEIVPMSLEEFFINKASKAGYNFNLDKSDEKKEGKK